MAALLLLFAFSAAAQIPAEPAPAASQAPAENGAAAAAPASAPLPPIAAPAAVPLRGVHLTGWAVGAPKERRRFIAEIKAAGLNSAAIALKEYDGIVMVKAATRAKAIGAYANALPDLPGIVREFKDAGIYVIGRIVLFKDAKLARARPDLAVHRPNGALWTDDKGNPWADPYRREVWDYNLEIAQAAAEAGFDEIQFDYIRFPSDGDVKQCRYAVAEHTKKTAAKAIADFLATARERLKPTGVKISVCLFGLTTSVDNGMGIGQHLKNLAGLVDFVAPMMYPSHYRRGELGIPNPNTDPYKTIHRGLRDAIHRLGAHPGLLRPYLQDFSLGARYGAEQVRAQILAAESHGVGGWMLWNAQNRYTWSALRHNNRSILEPSKEAAP